MTDINKLSIEKLIEYQINDLNDLKIRIDKAISKKKTENKKALISKIKEIASEGGFDINELFSNLDSNKSRKLKTQPKYVNPSDKRQRWNGESEQPDWLKNAIENGSKLEDFEVKSN